jgi:hypothetical protein
MIVLDYCYYNREGMQLKSWLFLVRVINMLAAIAMLAF